MKTDDIDKTLIPVLVSLRFDDMARDRDGAIVLLTPGFVHFSPELYPYLQNECNMIPYKKNIQVVKF